MVMHSKHYFNAKSKLRRITLQPPIFRGAETCTYTPTDRRVNARIGSSSHTISFLYVSDHRPPLQTQSTLIPLLPVFQSGSSHLSIRKTLEVPVTLPFHGQPTLEEIQEGCQGQGQGWERDRRGW